jgi:hypothetical protein
VHAEHALETLIACWACVQCDFRRKTRGPIHFFLSFRMPHTQIGFYRVRNSELKFSWLAPRRLLRSSRPQEICQPRREGFFSVHGLSGCVHTQLQLLRNIFRLFSLYRGSSWSSIQQQWQLSERDHKMKFWIAITALKLRFVKLILGSSTFGYIASKEFRKFEKCGLNSI